MILQRLKLFADRLSDEQKKYNKEERSRKVQKRGLDNLNAGTALIAAGGLAYGNLSAKENAEDKIKKSLFNKEMRDLDVVGKRDKAALEKIKDAADVHRKKFDEWVKQYKKEATKAKIPWEEQQMYLLNRTLGNANEEAKFMNDNIDRLREAEDKWLEKRKNDRVLAADRKYNQVKKKINKRTALIGTAVLAPAIGYGLVKRHKKDKDLKSRNPQNKDVQDSRKQN